MSGDAYALDKWVGVASCNDLLSDRCQTVNRTDAGILSTDKLILKYGLK